MCHCYEIHLLIQVFSLISQSDVSVIGSTLQIMWVQQRFHVTAQIQHSKMWSYIPSASSSI
jgi:hypothetical protein